MYELTCPACSKSVGRPFVRIGARAVCGKCEHAYQIAGQQVKHEVVISTFEPGQNPLLFGGAAAKPPPPMKPQPKAPLPPPAPEPDPEPVRTHSPPPSASVAKMIARRRAKRRRKKQIITLLVITGLLLASIGVGLFIYNSAQKKKATEAANANQSQTTDGSGSTAGSLQSRPVTKQIPTLQAEALAAPLWEEIYAAYESTDQPEELQLTGGRIVDMNNVESIYTAQVNSNPDDLIELAYVKLMLADTSQMIFAQAEVPMMLVGGPFSEDIKRRLLRVRIPRRLADRTISIHQNVEIIQQISEGKQITDLMVEPDKTSDQSTLNIKAYNPLTTAMQRAVLYIEALDSGGEVVPRYRVNWTEQVEARDRFEFDVALQTTRQWGIADWRVFAIAEPQETFGP